ncbi:hypothetical protein R6258_00975 [Halomonas sp. HP20-15]|uniref:hypothetical protein n=1 Tax=Halomonas sp. HP20-15 TaxID=3085901 RepID=UPI00298160FB|nr:hypothetical protein [Halomonas sp. HP20-15]MDW5375479.1 hypothetical protein [Halomonas sp. HP20-15]
MPIFSVHYDLNLPDEYAAFYDALETYKHLHVMDGCWLIEAPCNATDIRDQLRPHLTSQDALLVTHVNEDWAGAGTQCGDWLNENQRSFG